MKFDIYYVVSFSSKPEKKISSNGIKASEFVSLLLNWVVQSSFLGGHSDFLLKIKVYLWLLCVLVCACMCDSSAMSQCERSELSFKRRRLLCACEDVRSHPFFFNHIFLFNVFNGLAFILHLKSLTEWTTRLSCSIFLWSYQRGKNRRSISAHLSNAKFSQGLCWACEIVHGQKSYLASTDVQMKIVDVGVGGQAGEESPAETKQPSEGDNNKGGAPKNFHVFFISGQLRQHGAFCPSQSVEEWRQNVTWTVNPIMLRQKK